MARCRSNPNYSLRSFARSLRLTSSALSAILNGKRPITEKMKMRIGLALGMAVDELAAYSTAGKGCVLKFNQIDLGTFAIISDWYHYAILELIRVRSFQPDPKWIARALGLTRSEVNIAIERLLSTGLLKIEESGQWTDLSGDFATNIDGKVTSAASRKLQKQILEKSIEALETLDPSIRNHTAMTMAIDPKHLPIAIARIQEFRRGLCAELEKLAAPEGATQVYNLALSLYPLTRIEEEKGKKP